MKIKYLWKTFKELSIDDLYAILNLRQKVFVMEQDCPYIDADYSDQEAFHLLGYDEKNILKEDLAQDTWGKMHIDVYNGIFKTIKNEMVIQKKNFRVIDLYRDDFTRPREKIIDSYKKLVSWADSLYIISPVWWFRLTPRTEIFFDAPTKIHSLVFKLK